MFLLADGEAEAEGAESNSEHGSTEIRLSHHECRCLDPSVYGCSRARKASLFMPCSSQ
jgi:hypothetical protein